MSTRETVIDEGDCMECGATILNEATTYYDGQEVVCPAPGCRTIHTVCCDCESGIHLHTLGIKFYE